MSGPADNFDDETDALSDVRLAESGEYLHEYTGILAETDERVRILTLAPELDEIDSAVDAFARVSDQWYNASANANILTIRDRSTEPRPWIAVPDHDGDTLATLQPNLSPEAIETVISETADALRTLGLYNTVHGYLSPDDIYIPDAADQTANPTVHVGGFGLEAAVQAAVGEFKPTAYTAPELLNNPSQSTEQTDVYGLAAVTYLALTGHPPIEGADLDQAIRDGPSNPLSEYEDAIPGELDDVVLQALSTRPEDRYDSPYSFSRAFLSAFIPDEFRSDDAGKQGDDEGVTASSKSTDDVTGEEDDEPAESDDTDEKNVTRRAAVGLLGMGVLGGAGWFLSRGQLTAADSDDQTAPGPTDETAAVPVEDTAAPNHPVEPSASISVTPANPTAGQEVTFSANESTTGEDVSLESYEWAVSTSTEFSEGEETLRQSFSEPGEQTIRLRITDSQGRTATATTIMTVYTPADGAPMFQYDIANTGTTPDETGPQTPIGEQWSYQTGDSVASSPAVVDGIVYIGSNDGYVYALSAYDGTERWSFQTGDWVRSSPAVVDGTVYVGSFGGSVYAFSAEDGTEQWSFQTDAPIEYSSPAVVDSTVYVGGRGGTLYALSADDGTEQWSFRTGDRVGSSPAVVDGTVYIGSSDSNVYALSAEDGTELWSFRTGDQVRSSPTVVNGTVYVGSDDHSVYALSADDGTEQWSFQTDLRVWSSPAVVDGTLYVGSHDNEVYALSAEDGTEQWSYRIGLPVDSSPAVVDGSVYVGGSDNNVYALSADDGTEQWSYETGGWRVLSSPAVVGDTVYVGSFDNNVYALSEQ
ncbi:PQQ-binding-like beta-propeller repeat protein [Haloarcula onubensis]|uniref:PQQ-binding-like beta-propeller repeat protein n=1 Tax=Haloarcula onubensis TaxID=2950539 RepID=A0ABU2FUQ4_9EURY|nr:PQQ-binding-like beta-propeller repeat protein [Halomicroarcula sp. S3CR25-11]MDS0284499.1 PQQ-binding-like beta-propeller repeat protein [Halomicroarcula sp. S3CR25-11]